MSASQSDFTLRPLTASDTSTCAHLAGLAFAPDRQTQLKTLSPQNPYNHAKGMKSGLSSWLASPPGSVELTVAVDASDSILGWVAWGFRGFNSAAQVSRFEEESERLARDGPEALPPLPDPDAVVEAADMGAGARELIEAYTGAHMAAWMERLMPLGTRCMYICSIAVHPEQRGRGVGAALLRVGTERADEEVVFCWVHASEAGSGLFEAGGFNEVGRLDLDLDRWNVEGVEPPEGADTEWGWYTFRYMRREPRERKG